MPSSDLVIDQSTCQSPQEAWSLNTCVQHALTHVCLSVDCPLFPVDRHTDRGINNQTEKYQWLTITLHLPFAQFAVRVNKQTLCKLLVKFLLGYILWSWVHALVYGMMPISSQPVDPAPSPAEAANHMTYYIQQGIFIFNEKCSCGYIGVKLALSN